MVTSEVGAACSCATEECLNRVRATEYLAIVLLKIFLIHHLLQSNNLQDYTTIATDTTDIMFNSDVCTKGST